MTVWGVIRLVAGAGMIVVLGAATLMLWPLLWPPDPDTTVQLVNGRLVGETSGYVGRIDLDARTVDVSSSLVGWRPVVLVVNDQTAIQFQDRRGDIGDLVKDTPVRAFYEVVGDRRLAKSIEVVTDESGRAGGVASDAARTPPSPEARPETEGTPGPSAPASAAGMPPADVGPAAPGTTASPPGTIVEGSGGVAPPRASAAAAPPVTGPAPPATSAPPPPAKSAPPPPAVTIPSVPPQPVQRVEPAVPKAQAQLPEKRPEPAIPAAAGPMPDKRVEPVAPKPPATTPPKPPPAAPEKRAEAAAPEKRPEAAAPRPAASGEKRPESSVAPTPPAPRQDADKASPPRVAPQPPESDPGDGSAAVDWLLKRGR